MSVARSASCGGDLTCCSAENLGGYKRIEDVLERAPLRTLELTFGAFSENEAFPSFESEVDIPPFTQLFS
jgi:hypothetical protein